MNHFHYFSDIEAAFIRRRGKSLLLSPLDWSLIESWQKRGIPEHIVIRSIEKIFDDIAKDPKRNPSIKSIAYCTDEVERQYRDWAATQAGAHSTESESEKDEGEKDEIAAHLSHLIEQLGSAVETATAELKPALAEAVEGIKNLSAKGYDLFEINGERIERELTVLEAKLDGALLAAATEKEMTAAQIFVEEHLGQYAGKMQQDVYDKTYELMVIKKLREKAGIPAFSLFYL